MESKLWPLKLHYFLHGAGSAPVVSFLPVIMRQLGLSGSDLGLILGVNQIGSLMARPMMGCLLDRHPRKKMLMFQCLIVFCLLLLFAVHSLRPLQSRSGSMTVNACPDSSAVDELQLLLPGKVDPCLKQKLHSFYGVNHKCLLFCDPPMSSLSVIFNGNSAQPDSQERLTINVTHLNKADFHCSPHTACRIDCETDQDLNQALNGFKNDPDVKDRLSLDFLTIAVIWFLGAVSFGCIVTYQDAFCHQVLGKERGGLYGQQRLWASIGWGSMAVLAGWLVDQASQSKLHYDYSISFYILLICWTLDSVLVKLIKIPSSPTDKKGVHPLRSVRIALQSPKMVVFLMYCVAVGFLLGALSYQFLLVEDLAHRSDCNNVAAMKLLQGLCLCLNCIGEVPIFFYSGKLISKYGSTMAMNLVLLAFAVRYFFYYTMVSPWQTLQIEMINGITTGLFYSSMTCYVSQEAPRGSSITMTALAFAVTDGIGSAMGSCLAGNLIQSYGTSATFGLFSLVSVLAFIAHSLAQKMLQYNLTRPI